MKLALRHTLTFSLGTPARAVQHLLLTALSTPQQTIANWSIDMPGLADAAVFRDGFGNRAHLVSQVKPDQIITVAVTGQVETTDKAGVLGRLEYDPMPAMFRRQTQATEAGAELAAGLDARNGRISVLHELMKRAREHSTAPQMQQQSGNGDQSQTQGEAPVNDPAHLFVGGARSLGIPARYVTGYVLDDSRAMFHSWAEAWDEGLGWIGFDPVFDLCPTERHIRLASGLDATGTMPIRSVPIWMEMPAETIEIEML